MITKPSVIKYFIEFNSPMEGVVPHMYQDIKGLVTVGLGNLIEPIQLGMAFPWRRKDGSLASQSEYIAEWQLINSKLELAKEGWTAATRLCTLHLSPEDIQTIVEHKMSTNEAVLVSRVPNFASHCADVQLMLHSWAWAVGPNAGYPRMIKLIVSKNYTMAANECDINPKVGTIILRNAADRQLLLNGRQVENRPGELDPEVLMYPRLWEQDESGPDYSVVHLQHALSLLGLSLRQDGIMGPLTLAAVKTFQASRKLVVDGIVGPLTWASIQQALRYR